MISRLAIALAALLSAPVSADTTFLELSECGKAPIGTEGGCTPEGAMAALDGLEPAWGYRLRDSAGVEAYAVVSVLGQLKQGFEDKATGNCHRAWELAHGAGEIWTWYIAIGDDATEQGAIDYSTVENFTNVAIAFLTDPRPGACP